MFDLMANVKSCNYAEVMRADTIFHEAAASIPQPFKMKSMTASITDSPEVIMSWLFISHLFCKGQIMLHRRLVTMKSTSADEDPISSSRKAYLDASLCTLQIRHILDEETSAGGRFHAMHWRVSSIFDHHFLTATMILCSLLYRGETQHRKKEILTTLRSTRAIWMRSSSISQDARKAAETVAFVLVGAEGDRDYGIALDAERNSTTMMGQDMLINANGSSIGLCLDGEIMF
ncbi:hypothetical protein N7G274_000758 [Stereocaulon virgatum]|uniref:Uncharacterized protein n=1 Tax=Stereocaulon virgatum TaxID=373712 RepID=A0ABR4ASG2_9LECA